MARPSHVLHILKHYRPVLTDEGGFLERVTACMAAVAPRVEHDLLVTHTPEPEKNVPTCSTLQHVYYLTNRSLPAWRHELVTLVWFIRHVHRYDAIHVHTHADGYFLPYLLTKLFHRSLIFSATLDDSAGYLAPVQLLANDAAPQRAIGLRGRNLMRDEFDMAHVACKYLSAYGMEQDCIPLEAAVADETQLEVAEIASSSSVLSPRFRIPVSVEHLDKPLLLTVIDTEEAFDWDKPFTRSATDVASMASQEKAHRVFERYGVVPTYVVDYPVVSQDAGRMPLQDMLRDGRCDVGTHLHPWVSPPFLEEVTNRNSYPGNLPLGLEFAKLQRLTETIEDTFGVRPRIYRAGRYGVGPRTGDLLRHLGYLVDSSVMANWDFTAQDGPDFTAISASPYWIDHARSILEIPCTAAIVGSSARAPEFIRRAAFAPISKRLGIPSLTARLRLLERIRLTPEGITVTEGKRLLRYMRARGSKVFVLTYHSPSLMPGNTPYVRNSEDLARFLRWLDEIYAFFTTEIGGRSATWRDVHAAAVSGVASATPTAEAVPHSPSCSR